MTNNKRLGTFKVTSGAVMVSDPCYKRGTWCHGKIENVKNGVWRAAVGISHEGAWGDRVAFLIATHGDIPVYGTKLDRHEAEFEVGVDSGQAGIFDDTHYQDESVAPPDEPNEFDDRWYSMCCNATDNYAGIIPFGVVSSSGFGDGGYECTYYTNSDGEVVRIIIDYGLVDILDFGGL